MDKLPTTKQINSWYFQWLIKNTPSCKEATELLSQSMERPLPLGMRVKLRLHFIICRWCKRYMIQMRFLRRALHQYARRSEVASPALSSGARERLMQSLNRKLA